MCGLVYKHNYDGSPVNNDVMQQFDKQRGRGTEGFGVFDGQYLNIAKSTREDAILKWLCKYDSNLLLFHHRFPTSTVNVKRAAHPFSTGDFFGKNQYVLAHNGVIRNPEELRKKHEALGIKYKTVLEQGKFNDSEALLWDIALTLEGGQEEPKTRGDMAFICMKIVKGNLKRMYFGRNGRPLKMYHDKKTFELSSEGRGEDIQADQLYTWDFQRKVLKSRRMKFDVGWQPYTPSNYDNACYPYSNPHADQESLEGLGRKIASALGSGVVDLTQDIQRSPGGLLIPGKPAALLGEVVADKYGKYFDGKAKPDRSDELAEVLDTFEPSDDEVINTALGYLTTSEGNFDKAYLMVENDYVEHMESGDEDSFSYTLRQLLFEKVMEFICLDPEFENEKSISSMWSALWYQNQTA